MEDGINVRFYRVGRADHSHPLMIEQLRKIYKSGNQAARTKDANGIKVRLERFDDSNEIVIGEFVRLQEKGYPSEVHDDKVAPLSTNSPLGHHIAFAYSTKKHVLALEYDVKALALSRINTYISQFKPYNMYIFNPLFRGDTWTTVKNSTPRKITFAVAYPQLLSGIEGENKALYQNIADMSDRLGTHLVEMTLSMGQTKGGLKDALAVLKDLAKRGDSGEIDLRKLRTKVDTQDDEINLIDEVLNEKISIDLPRNNPAQSYNMRIAAIKAGLARNVDKFKK